ncbi:hypothetical protein CL614_06380 [archaeon]|nr:hypothetical protein [archaeon]|tara:strand:+ start:348 stop:620 length:273 start_codon:yes stop_codon:yes gene_type:complete
MSTGIVTPIIVAPIVFGPYKHSTCGTDCVKRTVPVHVKDFDDPSYGVNFCPHCHVYIAGAELDEFKTPEEMSHWVEEAILENRRVNAAKR